MRYLKSLWIFWTVGCCWAQSPNYLPTESSLSLRQTPAWYGAAKLGIFVHWGLYSVPGWATPTAHAGKTTDWRHFYKHNPYAEWYLNTLRIAGSPTQAHHAKTYGTDYDYYRFAETFSRENQMWQPDDWAALFKEAGAQYVVVTAKHHDGFVLYPSRIPNPFFDSGRVHATRDFVGELAQSVRKQRLYFGVYYSGGLDWTFYRSPVTNLWPDLFKSMPQSVAYTAYVDNHFYEIIHRYKPDVLWNDVNFPSNGDLLGIWAELYNHNPNAVVNNRWQRFDKLTGFDTPEYQVLDSITPRKWETCRGIGYSFGYNQNETETHLLSSDELIDMFVDIISKNGNLLLNVGPRANGTIPEPQAQRLRDLGAWLKVHGEAVYNSRPWVKSADGLADGTRLRFTQTDKTVYVFLLDTPKGKTVTIPNLRLTRGGAIRRLDGDPVRHRQTEKGIEVTFDGSFDPAATALAVTPKPEPAQ